MITLGQTKSDNSDGTIKSDHIKRMITLTGDNIKRLSLYNSNLATINVSTENYIAIRLICIDSDLRVVQIFVF